MTIKQRIQSPTPDFFKKVRTISMILAAVSASILAAPIALPAVILQVAGYIAVAGSVATAISQVTTTEEQSAQAKGSKEADDGQ